MPRKLKERNIPSKHNGLKTPNCRDADQLAIYKHDRAVEKGFPINNSTLVVEKIGNKTKYSVDSTGLEPKAFTCNRPTIFSINIAVQGNLELII